MTTWAMKWTMKMEERFLMNTAMTLDNSKINNNMERLNRGNKLTAQGVSEPPRPVGVAGVASPGSPRWLSSNWERNNEGKVDPRAFLWSERATGDPYIEDGGVEERAQRRRTTRGGKR
jgi:hypothetical protein